MLINGSAWIFIKMMQSGGVDIKGGGVVEIFLTFFKITFLFQVYDNIVLLLLSTIECIL